MAANQFKLGHLRFNGIDLEEKHGIKVLGIERGIMPEITLNSMSVGSRYGEVLTGVKVEPLDITVSCVFVGASSASAVAERRTLLAADLYAFGANSYRAGKSDALKQLYLPDNPLYYYEAVVAGQTMLDRNYGDPHFDITFHCPDPAAFGDAKTITLSGTDANPNYTTFEIGGNARTYPRISGTGGTSFKVFINGTYCQVYGSDVYIDAERCRISGGTIGLGSVFPSLMPGDNRIGVIGSAKIMYVERWI